MNIYLLTHQRELERKTNTGALVTELMGENCQVFIWDRVAPDSVLLEKINQESVALVYPSENGVSLATDEQGFDSFIIIDATWQEAQKMYNHSPYLHGLPKVNLSVDEPSVYTLRRNQKEAGLCTAECAAELLKSSGNLKQATIIEDYLKHFISAIHHQGR